MSRGRKCEGTTLAIYVWKGSPMKRHPLGGVAPRMRRLSRSCARLRLKQLSWMPGLGDIWETLKRREVEMRQCNYATICQSKM